MFLCNVVLYVKWCFYLLNCQCPAQVEPFTLFSSQELGRFSVRFNSHQRFIYISIISDELWKIETYRWLCWRWPMGCHCLYLRSYCINHDTRGCCLACGNGCRRCLTAWLEVVFNHLPWMFIGVFAPLSNLHRFGSLGAPT